MVIEEEPFDPEMNEMPAVDPNVSVPSATESETTSDEPVDVASVALIVPTNVNKPFSFRLALAGRLLPAGQRHGPPRSPMPSDCRPNLSVTIAANRLRDNLH